MEQISLIQVPVDEDFKKEIDDLFIGLGYDTPSAIRMFLRRAIQCHGLPFTLNSRDLHST